MGDPRALHPGIEVGDVDEERTALVRRRRHGARQLFLPEVRGDGDDLPFLHVRAVDRQLGECLEALVHARDPSDLRVRNGPR